MGEGRFDALMDAMVWGKARIRPVKAALRSWANA